MPKDDAKFKVGDLVKFVSNHILEGPIENPTTFIIVKTQGYYVHAQHLDLSGEPTMYHRDDFVIYSAAPKT